MAAIGCHFNVLLTTTAVLMIKPRMPWSIRVAVWNCARVVFGGKALVFVGAYFTL
jgi:hypothetical protein